MREDEDRMSAQSTEEEDGDKEEAIQVGIFEQYLSICDEAEVDAETDALFARGLVRVQEYLSGGSDNTRCLICLGSIKPTEAIWGCSSSCFALFHLPCIQEWARNQLDLAAYKASRQESTGAAPVAREWGCPKCRFSYTAGQLPNTYTCFCGKKEDPEWDPWLAPHSCGELCGKQMSGKCQHGCMLLCHPGPCPPCPLLVDAFCYCRKARMKQRCGNNEFSCRDVCGKVLPCGHKCPDICHPGECPPCQVVQRHKCACGAETASLPCFQSDWHCNKPCSTVLACRRHKCDQVCHAGPCGPCPEEGERRCPCGKALYPDLKCDENAPVCGATCGKLLQCRVHTCQERCHYGPCTKVCRELVSKPCRCGRTEKQVLCSADVRCESKCNGMRSCGRHACKRRCCDGECPLCEEVCNRKLRCGNHRCPATCHSGPCRPCPLSQTISCACGKTGYTLPCGAEAAAAPPRCLQKCAVPLVCRHAADAKPHRCHFGPCPPCKVPCGTGLACGHTCSSSSCHDRPPPAVAVFERPKPPKPRAPSGSGDGKLRDLAAAGGSAAAGAPTPPALAAAATAAEVAGSGAGLVGCPACAVPVSVGCLGGHVVQERPCCSAGPFSCSAACGRPLACGNHSCSKPCHAVTGESAASSSSAAAAKASIASAGAAAAAAAVACEVCTRPCSQPRSCSHPCTSTCHPGPCAPCAVPCSVECHCGKSDLSFPCSEYQTIVQQQQQRGSSGRSKGSSRAAGDDPLCCGKSCHRELPFCPHTCKASCHAGVCPDARSCSEEVSVRCSCRRLKEKWPCSKVQAALAPGSNGTSGRIYDGSTALKLLPCDGQCAAAQKDKQQQPAAQSSRDDSPERAVLPVEKSDREQQHQSEQQQQQASKGAKRLSRAEREALAAAKEAERLQQEKRERLKKWAIIILVVMIVVVVGTCLALGLEMIDQKLQDKYKLSEEL